jgi:hypothetical protein
MVELIPSKFNCPDCDSLYNVARMNGDPDKTYSPVRCIVCAGSLAATDGNEILKYFLVRRSPNRRRGTRAPVGR